MHFVIVLFYVFILIFQKVYIICGYFFIFSGASLCVKINLFHHAIIAKNGLLQAAENLRVKIRNSISLFYQFVASQFVGIVDRCLHTGKIVH